MESCPLSSPQASISRHTYGFGPLSARTALPCTYPLATPTAWHSTPKPSTTSSLRLARHKPLPRPGRRGRRTQHSLQVFPSRHAVQCSIVQKVSSSELDAILNAEERKLPVVIDFYATWCGPCMVLASQLEQLAVEYHGAVHFVKVDTDEEYELANQLQIRGLPTIVFVSKDKEKLAKRAEGVLPLETLKELIDDL